MAKYIILNGQRNYITLTRHLLLKIIIRHLERDRAKNEPQSLQMPDDSFLFTELSQVQKLMELKELAIPSVVQEVNGQ